MSTKVSSVIEDIGYLIADPRHRSFSQDYKLKVLNQTLEAEFSQLLTPYTKTLDVQLYEAQRVYEFPSDMIELIHAQFVGFSSEVVFNSTYMGISPTSDRAEIQGSNLIFNDRVSSNEFEFVPMLDSDSLTNGGTVHEGDLPESASEDDVYKDRNGGLFFCNTSYTAGAASLTVTTRPDTDLTFTAKADGTAFIQIKILDGGASGTSELTDKDGAGTYDDPIIYTFTMFDDNNSNDDLIALLAGDPDLEATGSSATDGDVTAVGLSDLINAHEDYWSPFKVTLWYKSSLPRLSSVDEDLHACLPAPLNNGDALAKLTASRLLMMKPGGDKQMAEIRRQEGLSMISETKFRRNRTMRPASMRSGI